jgi:hypothetical protein
MRNDVARAVVRGAAADLDQIKLAGDDLAGAGRIAQLDFEPAEGSDLTVDVTM